ncbi:Clp protease N-terminal domain-containing protein [Actinomadura sp. DC4]|uniref:Clp protease N-terminal domain-containing protein n=1 Tax=Actinomadura sp. DC4 TaxID=3055069 RepID=UPI0025AF1F9E|nr:Clp protease N-terminal domain-containing protein [Actinomadura sp. DC4]MDN3359506.1 Clp protease N-terminal domain-containing protein [Actinomadura sp. DC4]
MSVRLDDLIDEVRTQSTDGSPLDHLSDAVLISQRLGEIADHLIGHFVDQARRAGASWTEIGSHMGVTKQAAQKRFVPNETVKRGGWARFTEPARHALLQAQEEARTAGHAHIGTEHILLGLLHEPDALAARAITAQSVTLDQVRTAVTAAFDPPEAEPPGGHIPFTRHAKKVRELTVREALRLDDEQVGTEHVLLGLLGEEEGRAAGVLAGLKVTKAAAETWIAAEKTKA